MYTAGISISQRAQSEFNFEANNQSRTSSNCATLLTSCNRLLLGTQLSGTQSKLSIGIGNVAGIFFLLKVSRSNRNIVTNNQLFFQLLLKRLVCHTWLKDVSSLKKYSSILFANASHQIAISLIFIVVKCTCIIIKKVERKLVD